MTGDHVRDHREPALTRRTAKLNRPGRWSRVRVRTLIVASALVAVSLAGASVAAGVATSHTAAAATGARIVRWVDGDTVETTRGTIRLIGIDTAERGRCGYGPATRHAQSMAPAGSRVVLGNPATVVDRDRYGRKLRYVVTLTGRDLGLAQVRAGAKARYDSRDGYQWHRREAAYHRADGNNPDYRCGGGGSTNGGSVTPIDGECPDRAPLKGNANSMIYHRPGQQYYDVTVAEECFATAAAAGAAGYRAAKV